MGWSYRNDRRQMDEKNLVVDSIPNVFGKVPEEIGERFCGKDGPAEKSADYDSGLRDGNSWTTPSTRSSNVLDDVSERTKRLEKVLGPACFVKTGHLGIFRRPGSHLGRKREDIESGAVSMNTQGGSFLDERSISPEVTVSSRMRSDASTSDFDAIARAPHLTVSQLHGMLQIDAFASKYPHLAKLDDIDISLLTRYLYTEEEVKDEDVPWTWDYLFASVSSELREEWAQEEADDT